jgi:hypothetical protein
MAKKSTPTDADDKVARQNASREFALARAEAINTYAGLEQNLGLLFETLLCAPSDRAYVVFGLIQDSRRRLRMIQDLLRLAHSSEYDDFFDSLVGKLPGTDGTRNKIVHWITLNQTAGKRNFNPKKDIFLQEHPNIYSPGKFYQHEILHFTRQCRFYSMLVYYFRTYLLNPSFLIHGPPKTKPWHEIFHEEVAYPPPKGTSVIADAYRTRSPASIISGVISVP